MFSPHPISDTTFLYIYFTLFMWTGTKDESQVCKKIYFWIYNEYIFYKM